MKTKGSPLFIIIKGYHGSESGEVCEKIRERRECGSTLGHDPGEQQN